MQLADEKIMQELYLLEGLSGVSDRMGGLN